MTNNEKEDVEMGNVWVCKPDGTIQCDQNSREITLEEMREELSTIIGSENIINMEKRSHLVIQMCGMPTGVTNAYEITKAFWENIKTINDTSPALSLISLETALDSLSAPIHPGAEKYYKAIFICD